MRCARTSAVTAVFVTALAAATATAPSASAAVGCGAVLRTSTTLTTDLVCADDAGSALVIGANGITLDLGGHTITVHDTGTSTDTDGVIRNSGFDDVVIRNGSIEAFYTGLYGVLVADGANDNQVTSLTGSTSHNFVEVRDSLRTRVSAITRISTDYQYAVHVRGSSGAQVTGVRPNNDGAVWLENTSDSVVSANTPGPSDVGTIYVKGDRNQVRGNDLTANSWIPVNVYGGSGNQVVGNTVGNTQFANEAGVWVGAAATGTRVQGNHVQNSRQAGIVVEAGSTGTVVESNTARANAGDGIRSNAASTTFRSNSSSGNGGWGIRGVAGAVDGGANSAYANTAGNCTPIKCVGALVGDQVAGTKWTPVTANAKRVSRFSGTTPVTARQLRVYLDGKAGAAGSQSLRGVLYADNAGSPSRRLATTSAVTINAGRAAGWVTLTLPASVTLQAGTPYWIGLHSGTTNKVARFAGTSAAAALRWNTDSYADGASSAFGAASTDSTRVSAFATGG